MILTVFFLALIAALAPAPPAPAQAVDLNEIVAKHIEAIGGKDAIDKLQDYKLVLKYEEGTFSALSSLAQARPDYRLVRVPDGPVTNDSILEGYDGAPWEYYANPGIVLRTVGSAAAVSTRSAHQFVDAIVDARAGGAKLAYVGPSELNGKPVYVVSVRYPDGTVNQLLIDRLTFLIDGFRQNIQVHAYGKSLATRIELADYRPVAGVLMPFQSQQVEETAGKVLNSTVVLSAEANVGLSPGAFAPPTFTPTPLQAMIAGIYAKRSDPGAAMQLYNAYRQQYGVGSLAAAEAVEFVGYQSLKMGAVDTAVKVLTANVADHPTSATAHFNLGRALAAAHDTAGAKQEFKRALQLDPTLSAAAAALDSLGGN